MKRRASLLIVCGFIMLMMVPVVWSDTIYLKNGTILEVEYSWEEDGLLKFYRYGTLVSYPIEDVDRVEKPEDEAAAKTPEELEEERLWKELTQKQEELKKLRKNIRIEEQRVEQLKSEDMARYVDEREKLNQKIDDYKRKKEELEKAIDAFNEKYGTDGQGTKGKKRK